MVTRRLMQLWIFLALGVVPMGLACSKEQMDQFKTNPVQLVQSAAAAPCTPGGIASTSTPEFCINLTEMQLLNGDTEADVGMTLVNRTGRRIFVSLSTSPYLTDSNGGKWDRKTVTGIGFRSTNNVPLPLEPNTDTHISFVFGRSGRQSATDLTFSMRGEIALMRVDSRGQAHPIQTEVNRGFNISGIRPPDTSPFGSLMSPPSK